MMNYFSIEISFAFGTMLLHSLWQITVVALLLKLIAPFLKSAQQRYRLYFGGLCLILMTAVLTFGLVLNKNSAEIANLDGSLGIKALNKELVSNDDDVFNEDLIKFSKPYQELITSPSNYPYIVALWVFGVFIFLLKMLFSIYFTKKMLRTQTQAITKEWQTYLDELLFENKIKQSVKIIESALISIPCVIGYIKPVILLPIGLVNQLPEKEVEAIIAHEVAHIIRKDWLLNVFQHLVEAIFYFHPAIWWISDKISVERENCCDDFVISKKINQLTYAKALLHTKEFSLNRLKSSRYMALALDGAVLQNSSKNKFLHRIQRILNQSQVKTPIMEKITATSILLAIVTLLCLRLESAPLLAHKIAVFNSNPSTMESETPDTNTQISITTDTVPNGVTRTTQKISTDDGKQKVEMTLENNQITALNVDGKDIPANEYGNYQTITDRLRQDLKQDERMEALNALEVPDLPDLPELPPFPSDFEEGDFTEPPPFPNRTQITTDKDEKGNTTIRLNQNGKPTEIIVKDGVVFIDGKQMENGQAIEINDAEDGNSFSYHYDDANEGGGKKRRTIRSEDRNIVIMDDQMSKEHAEAMQRHKEGMKSHENDMKQHTEDMKKHDKDMKKMEKQIYIIEKKAAKEQEAAEKEMEKEMQIREKQIRIQTSEIGDAQMNNKPVRKVIINDGENDNDFGILLRGELKKDKLIKGATFAIELSKEKFLLNGEKQPDTVHEKYLQLFEKTTGNRLGKGNKVVIQEN
jgi:bla regulator protein blaR1